MTDHPFTLHVNPDIPERPEGEIHPRYWPAEAYLREGCERVYHLIKPGTWYPIVDVLARGQIMYLDVGDGEVSKAEPRHFYYRGWPVNAPTADLDYSPEGWTRTVPRGPRAFGHPGPKTTPRKGE